MSNVLPFSKAPGCLFETSDPAEAFLAVALQIDHWDRDTMEVFLGYVRWSPTTYPEEPRLRFRGQEMSASTALDILADLLRYAPLSRLAWLQHHLTDRTGEPSPATYGEAAEVLEGNVELIRETQTKEPHVLTPVKGVAS